MTKSPDSAITTQREADIARQARFEVLLEQTQSEVRETKKLVTESNANVNAKFEAMDKRFVERTEFAPVKSVVYGQVGIILVAVLTAIVYLVVKK